MRPKARPADLHWPTDREETAIQRGIAADPDNPELANEDWAGMRPASDIVPDLIEDYRRRVRGPQKAPLKELVSIRLDRDVLDRLRRSGRGWQARVNDILRRTILSD